MTVVVLGFRLKEDPASFWIANDIVLKKGEPGLDTTTNRLKIGDGTKKWTELNYQFEFLPRVEKAITAGYTLKIADLGYVIEATSTGAIKIPGNVFPENAIIGWCQAVGGEKGIKFELGTGLTNLRSTVTPAESRIQWSEGLIRYRTKTEAIVSGDLA